MTAISLATVTPSTAAVANIDVGGFAIAVSDSWTAQVFHIVGQLSGM